MNFHRNLSQRPPPGFLGCGSYRITAVPWLGNRAGYEDWCYLDGSWALDPLNGFAVAGQVEAPHNAAAAQMDVGHGGLYSLMWGTPDLLRHSSVAWLTRPRGIQWRSALEPLRAKFSDMICWRRQMVLGPAPEFAVMMPSGHHTAMPADWTVLHIGGERLGSGGET